MSIQFRSRIKSTVNYSKILNGIGVCCDKDGNKTLKAFYDCFNDGGNFFPANDINDVTCPGIDEEKGCCCSCSFVSNLDELTATMGSWDFITSKPSLEQYFESGVICNISRCECERLNGKFTPSTETEVALSQGNIQDLCYKPAPEFGEGYVIDARYPRSCCYLERDPNSGVPLNMACENVCMNSDCASLGTSTNPAVFDVMSLCGQNLYIDLNGANGLAVCSSGLKLSQITLKNTVYKNQDFGSCYELVLENNNFTYQCEIKPKILCEGYWVESQHLNNAFCDNKYTPTDPSKINNKYSVQQMSQSEFSDLGLRMGQTYQGGNYIGIFQPGPPINTKGSLLNGNMNFDIHRDFYPDSIGIGGTHKKWAIIADAINVIDIPFIETDEDDIHYETSIWDGYYNVYGNSLFAGISTKLMNTIKYKPRNGFIDYYIPSLHELYFYLKYVKSNSISYEPGYYMTSTLFNTKYLNSKSNKTKINNKGFVYGVVMKQNAVEPFSTVLVEKYDTVKAIFFRKIVITD